MSKTTISSLAILLSHDKLSYITKKTDGEKISYSDVFDYSVDFTNLNKTEVEIEHELRSNLTLLQEYDFVHFCFLSTAINVVPNQFFHHPLEDLLSMSMYHPVQLAIDCPLQSIEASIVYNIHYPLKDVLLSLKNLQNARLYHSGKFLIDYAKINSKDDEIYVNLVHQKLEICVLSNGEFIFYNLFEIKTKEDFLFYILYTLNQLNINPNAVSLFIFGDVLDIEFNDYIDMLKKYIKNIEFNKDDKQLGKYFTLYKLFECELFQEH
ncbi:DUF3822 family protein [Chishuiella sp.]|uniref:DUF3822 family protein n=1 Tax=Chishuiella sp. TaxID=1969467 RepID=UPI0028AE96D5|nr:DUF3822 family protein [Chishuiella sp.]